MNFRLRLAMDKAKQNNMPMESIQRAIDRGLGKGNESAVEETIFYEGYAPGGVALLIEAATDNRNRTSSDVRAVLTKNGASPGEPGSVSWMFEQKGLITIELEGTKLDPEEVTLMAIDAGADDVEVSGKTLEVYTEWTRLNEVRVALLEHNIPIANVERVMRPKTRITLEEKDALPVLRLMAKLEELDDVQQVYSNLDMSDELLNKYSQE